MEWPNRPNGIGQFKDLELQDGPSSFHLQDVPLAELSRPARKLKLKVHNESRKPQGRKAVKIPRPAKYMNWHTPFVWSQIETVAKIAGPKMSATEMIRELQKRNPDTFQNLSRTTVRGWINKDGDMPRWSDAVVQKVKQGNDPGHRKGGRKGILVSQSDEVRQHALT